MGDPCSLRSSSTPGTPFQRLFTPRTGVRCTQKQGKKIMAATYFRELLRFLQLVSWSMRKVHFKETIVAALPAIAWFLIFNYNNQIRSFTYLREISPPNYVILSSIEYRLFFCYPHRILSHFANPLFDILAAIPYLIHFPLAFVFGAYLAIHPQKRPAFFPFWWCIGWVFLTAVIFHTIFPTAAPYLTEYTVFDQHGGVVYEPPNEAGFRRFDELIGFSIFRNLYAQSPLRFGAFPSLHIGTPTVILLNHPWFGKRVVAVHVLWISLASLYSTLHYLVDVLGGIALALLVRYCMLKIWSPFPELREVQRRDSRKNILSSNS